MSPHLHVPLRSASAFQSVRAYNLLSNRVCVHFTPSVCASFRLTASPCSAPSLHVTASPRFDPSVSIPPQQTGDDSSHQRILRVAPSNLITATPPTRSSWSDPSVRITFCLTGSAVHFTPSCRTPRLTGSNRSDLSSHVSYLHVNATSRYHLSVRMTFVQK